jgi:ABC-2 type transport system ATP-binding protein
MTTTHDFIISTRNLTKKYGKKRVVNQLNMEIPRGSICGFLGSNGAGKTTTLKMLLGLVKPSQGSGTIFGKNIVKDSIAIRQRVGFLSQSPNFYNYLTARETLRFVTSFFFKGSNSALEAHIEEYLELVGLSRKADRSVGGFSGGERQRLGIAQAAINEPELIILDEPASALDPLGRRDVLKILENFRGRSTVFYSTHILDDVQRVSDWIIIVQQGKLVTQGSIDQLLTNDLSLFEITVKGDGLKVCDRLKQIPWIKNVSVKTSVLNIEEEQTTKLQIQVTNLIAAETELLRFILADSTIIVTQFGRSVSNLEDVFVNLVEGKTKHDSSP